MQPVLFGNTSAYFLSWQIAALACTGAAVLWAVRDGFPAGRSICAIVCLAGLILVGSKTLWAVESWLFPQDDYVPHAARNALHGFRIPGGILASALGLPLVGRLCGLPWRAFGDRVVPWSAAALILIRFGCFLNGCCFGTVSDVPWAAQFPLGSWTYWYHLDHGWIAKAAMTSLPTHPLQLYFVVAAIGIAGLLFHAQRRRRRPAGQLQAVFYVLFFVSTAALEPFRQNQLTLNYWVTVLSALAGGACWMWARATHMAAASSPPRRMSPGRTATKLASN